MDLHSGLPYFLIKKGLPHDYPKLEKPISTDVVVMGGGISGALMAYYLTVAGINAVVVDARTIGLGSTASSTSLLQYEIDVPLCKLIEQRGYNDAVKSFVLCKEAIDRLEKISASIGVNYFNEMKSLYFAAGKKDTEFLKKEFAARKQAGFHVDMLGRDDIRGLYGFDSEAAILSHHGAQIDAYTFTHDLLRYSMSKGLKVFDRTTITKITDQKNGVRLKTKEGQEIKSRKLINATGYEVLDFIDKKIVKLRSTYAIISEHGVRSNVKWRDDTMFWNTADPYLYMTSLDGRIMVGGRDEDYYNPVKRDKLIKSKSRQLTNDFKKLFPDVPFIPEFRWAGTFGSTKDGLPFIGRLGNQSHVYYALGFGGNGITFSVIAAEIISSLIGGKPSADAAIFSFDRV